MWTVCKIHVSAAGRFPELKVYFDLPFLNGQDGMQAMSQNLRIHAGMRNAKSSRKSALHLGLPGCMKLPPVREVGWWLW